MTILGNYFMFLPLREYSLAILSNLENFRIVSMSGNEVGQEEVSRLEAGVSLVQIHNWRACKDPCVLWGLFFG